MSGEAFAAAASGRPEFSFLILFVERDTSSALWPVPAPNLADPVRRLAPLFSCDI
jgi:hypothetical protein